MKMKNIETTIYDVGVLCLLVILIMFNSEFRWLNVQYNAHWWQKFTSVFLV